MPFTANASGGTALRGHVYVPNGSGPFATILVFMPYLNHGGAGPSDEMDTREDGRRTMIERGGFQALMDHGFAVALVNVRGTGISDGCYSYMNHPVNGPDANAVVDALANSSWSNGKVGMFGLSYAGATQYAAIAVDGPSPHLKAVLPVSGEWDEWNLLGRWGAAIDSSWGSHPLRRDVMQGLGVASTMRWPGQYTPTPEHTCAETVTQLGAYEELKVHGDKAQFYEARDLREGLRSSSIPTFATNGMTQAEGHILQFEGLWDLIPHEDKRLMVGQWGHGFPFDDADRFTQEYAVPWFDHYLRDGPPVETDLVDYQDGTGTWHESASWPPANATATRLHLSNGRLVQDTGNVSKGSQRFLADDDARPVPDACPGDEAVYVSPPLSESVRLAGNVRINFTVTSTSPNENLAVSLWTGDGIPPCSASPQGETDSRLARHAWALSDLRHRGHLEQGKPFPVGEPGVVEMRSMPLAEVLPAGSRLILSIGAGHPELLPKPGSSMLTVETGPDQAGTLALPTVSGPMDFEERTNDNSAEDPRLAGLRSV